MAFLSFTDIISRDCSDYLKNAGDNSILYRGMNRDIDYGHKNIRTDRKPSDSSAFSNVAFNFFLYEVFKIDTPVRLQSVFATNSAYEARRYGLQHYFFPKNKSKVLAYKGHDSNGFMKYLDNEVMFYLMSELPNGRAVEKDITALTGYMSNKKVHQEFSKIFSSVETFDKWVKKNSDIFRKKFKHYNSVSELYRDRSIFTGKVELAFYGIDSYYVIGMDTAYNAVGTSDSDEETFENLKEIIEQGF